MNSMGKISIKIIYSLLQIYRKKNGMDNIRNFGIYSPKRFWLKIWAVQIIIPANVIICLVSPDDNILNNKQKTANKQDLIVLLYKFRRQIYEGQKEVLVYSRRPQPFQVSSKCRKVKCLFQGQNRIQLLSVVWLWSPKVLYPSSKNEMYLTDSRGSLKNPLKFRYMDNITNKINSLQHVAT